MKIELTRRIELPDPVKLAIYRRSPDLGPKILFFSGGTALRDLSRELVWYTHNSIHVITPFDSGGSSAKLRQAFRMPAVGDVRNRLMALADQSLHGNPQIFELFAHRLPKDRPPEDLFDALAAMTAGKHPLVKAIPDPMRKIIRHYLSLFEKYVPESFDPRGASIGNLVLTGGYLDTRRLFDPVIYIFSKLVQVRGTVRPVVNKDLHLAAELSDSTRVIGQHRLTGKEEAPIRSRVERFYLVRKLEDPKPVEVSIREKMRELIGTAQLVCYPMGSFYSSLLANLLPKGVGRAVAATRCPKVFIPSTGVDPEAHGMTVTRQVEKLVEHLCRDAPSRIARENVLDFVLIDERTDAYSNSPDRAELERLGLRVISSELVTPESYPLIDEKRLVPLLLSLA
jgi:CofD-related protein of GAK system